MFCHRRQRELQTVDDAWDVLLTVKGGPSSGGGVKSSGGVGGGSGVQRLRRTELVRGYLVSRIGAHIFAGGLSQYPEFLAGVFDLQFDFCAGICVVSCH